MHNPLLSYPHNLNKRKIHEQIQKGIPCALALPISYSMDAEVQISNFKRQYGAGCIWLDNDIL